MKTLGIDSLRSPDPSDDDAGMIGIGTMIVFIAMVIVASVAAGVLINTAGALQQQARATGEETITEVSSGAKVLGIKGKTNPENEIDNIYLIVRPYAGTRGINLESTVIQYKSKYEAYHLTYGETANENNFSVTSIQDVTGTGGTMLKEMGDISMIKIDIRTNLVSSEKGSVSIIPNVGFQSYRCLIIPTTLHENSWYEL